MTGFVEWYAANKESFNAKRRKRYKSDPDYRSKQLKNSKRWRKSHPQIKAEKSPKTNFSIGEVAEHIGCSIIVIRTYERKGLIPVAAVEGKHRRYTVKQRSLIEELYSLRSTYHYNDPVYKKKLAVLLQRINKVWAE